MYTLRYVVLDHGQRIRKARDFPSAEAARSWAVRFAHIVDCSVWLGRTCVWSL